MNKFIFWLVFFGVLVAWWRWRIHFQKDLFGKNSTREHPSRSAASKEQGIMLCCSYCGLHFPQEEAIYAQHKTFCSTNHCAEYLAQKDE